MTRRRPHANSVWPTRRDLSGAYVNAHGELISMWLPGDSGEDEIPAGYVHLLTRSEARLLAKRLNQCLDATVLR
jgi:hypothetical protein